VRHYAQCTQQPVLCAAVNDQLRNICRCCCHLQVRLQAVVLIPDKGMVSCRVCQYIFFMGRIECHRDKRFPRYCIAEVAAGEIADPDVILLLKILQQPGYYLYGIAVALVYLIA